MDYETPGGDKYERVDGIIREVRIGNASGTQLCYKVNDKAIKEGLQVSSITHDREFLEKWGRHRFFINVHGKEEGVEHIWKEVVATEVEVIHSLNHLMK